MANKVRQSNIELLRIVAMLMVLLLHATLETFGYARVSAITHAPMRWLALLTTASSCMVCVDVFVLITGWFGTTFKSTGLLRIVGECTFVSLSMFLLMHLVGWSLPQHPIDYIKVIWSYWFVRAYVLLYLFTPVLNSFVQQCNEKQLRQFLITFFAISIPLSFVSSDLSRGFSTISFLGLYLLGRYLRLHLNTVVCKRKKWQLLLPYLINTLLLSLVAWSSAFISPQFHNWFIPFFTAYSNPFVIISACSLLLYFTRLQLKSKTINWLAAGSFAAYLTHQQIYIRPHYFKIIQFIDKQVPSTLLYALSVTAVVASIFVFSTMLSAVWLKIYTALLRICLHKKHT